MLTPPAPSPNRIRYRQKRCVNRYLVIEDVVFSRGKRLDPTDRVDEENDTREVVSFVQAEMLR